LIFDDPAFFLNNNHGSCFTNMKKHTSFLNIFLLLVLILTAAANLRAATQIDINGQPGGTFGASVAVLPNGNFVVTDPTFDVTSPQTITDAGAVFLYSPAGTLISRLTGSCTNDNVGSGGIKVLANGNYVVSSPRFDYPNAGGAITNNCLNGGQRSFRTMPGQSHWVFRRPA
jgi:hypothetical protein